MYICIQIWPKATACAYSMKVHYTLDRIVQFARLEIKETSVSNKEKSVRKCEYRCIYAFRYGQMPSEM